MTTDSIQGKQHQQHYQNACRDSLTQVSKGVWSMESNRTMKKLGKSLENYVTKLHIKNLVCSRTVANLYFIILTQARRCNSQARMYVFGVCVSVHLHVYTY